MGIAADLGERRFEMFDFTLPVLMGIMPLYSARHAHFLHNEIPGITIPEAILHRMKGGKNFSIVAVAEGAMSLKEALHR